MVKLWSVSDNMGLDSTVYKRTALVFIYIHNSYQSDIELGTYHIQMFYFLLVWFRIVTIQKRFYRFLCFFRIVQFYFVWLLSHTGNSFSHTVHASIEYASHTSKRHDNYKHVTTTTVQWQSSRLSYCIFTWLLDSMLVKYSYGWRYETICSVSASGW